MHRFQFTSSIFLIVISSIFDVGLFSLHSCNYLHIVDHSRKDLEICSSQYNDEAAKEITSDFLTLKERDCALANPRDYPPNYDPEENEEFDFIVVGAGSAGNVVANRLSEVSQWRVLLLEAGGDPTKTSEVPALFPFLQKTELDWQYKSDPDEDNCLGMNGNMCNLPRGKVLGGTSTINYMAYVRGNAKDYDDWAAAGNTGWSYKEVLPYFKKLEDMRDKIVQKMPNFNIYHNEGGPMKVEASPHEDVKLVFQAIAEGMKELGYPVNYDINGPSQTGYAVFQGTLKDGKRCSTTKAYLSPITNRKNLKVSKNSLVLKVLLDSKKRACGVQFINKQRYIKTVRAKKEVVLCAGAINSPQLLMLSGIGPKKKLTKFNIPVVQDLPVGKNLQDHTSMFGLVMTMDLDQFTESQEESILNFLLRNDSTYSSLGTGAFAPFINIESGARGYPNVAFYSAGFAKNDTGKMLKFLDNLNVKKEITKEYLYINRNSYSLVFLICVLTPFSRGSVELRSNDPTQYPKITTGLLTNQKDIDILLKSYEFLYSLVATKGLKKRNARIYEIKIPKCMKHAFASKAYRICALRHLTSPLYHHCGTCKMGPAHKSDSVVDPQLRVKGVRRLRVVDGSIMPNVPRGNTNVPIIMIGEKGSDTIKKYWLSKIF